MKKKKTKSKAKTKAKAKTARAKAKTKAKSHLRQSKSGDFLERFKKDNSMVEYFTRLRILNPAAELNEPRREGGFVRLAHANEEFTAPVLTKGKSVQKEGKKKKTP